MHRSVFAPAARPSPHRSGPSPPASMRRSSDASVPMLRVTPFARRSRMRESSRGSRRTLGHPTGTFLEAGTGAQRAIVADRGANAFLRPDDLGDLTGAAVLVSGYVLLHDDTFDAGRAALEHAAADFIAVDAGSARLVTRVGAHTAVARMLGANAIFADAAEAKALTGETGDAAAHRARGAVQARVREARRRKARSHRSTASPSGRPRRSVSSTVRPAQAMRSPECCWPSSYRATGSATHWSTRAQPARAPLPGRGLGSVELRLALLAERLDALAGSRGSSGASRRRGPRARARCAAGRRRRG